MDFCDAELECLGGSGEDLGNGEFEGVGLALFRAEGAELAGEDTDV